MQDEHNPFGSNPHEGLTVWKIAIGVCIGSLIASAITWAAAEARIRWELQEASAALAEQTARAQRTASQAQRDAIAAIQRAAREQEQAGAEQRRQLAEQQRAESDRRRVSQEESSRKEAAWRRFYKPSPACVTASTSIECANEHIRATRAFEAKYSAGEL
jgi:multidrug efflux pump subunit AcrA (membrane-fusion protein)